MKSAHRITKPFSPKAFGKTARVAITSLAMAGLVACSSTDETLTVTADQAAPATPLSPSIAAESQSLAQAGTYAVYFAPIVGAPVDKVTMLSRRLSAAAGANSVSLQPSNSQATNHEIRGFFSAFSEEGKTTVIHVWDIFTPNGQRVYRIQGQEQITGSASDPWSVVPSATMERIADDVLTRYANWRKTGA